MTKSYRKGPLDPDTFQKKDIKRRVRRLERQRQMDQARVDRLVAKLQLNQEVLERLVASLKPVLPPPGKYSKD